MSLLKIPSFLQVQVLLTVFILNTCTTVVYVIFSKNSSQSVSCETCCKGKDFYFYLPNFFEVFFDLFFWKTSGRISDICLDSSNLILFPLRVLNPLSIMSSLASLSIAGAKVLLYNISSKSFYYFFLFIFYYP